MILGRDAFGAVDESGARVVLVWVALVGESRLISRDREQVCSTYRRANRRDLRTVLFLKGFVDAKKSPIKRLW